MVSVRSIISFRYPLESKRHFQFFRGWLLLISEEQRNGTSPSSGNSNESDFYLDSNKGRGGGRGRGDHSRKGLEIKTNKVTRIMDEDMETLELGGAKEVMVECKGKMMQKAILNVIIMKNHAM